MMEALARLTGAIIILAIISAVFDTLFSWLACISVNAAFHTHLGTFTLFWIIVVANFWLSANVTAIIKNSK